MTRRNLRKGIRETTTRKTLSERRGKNYETKRIHQGRTTSDQERRDFELTGAL